MQQMRLAGPGSGAEKYDVLTALAVKALSSSGSMQTSLLRLIAVVTARYNWIRDELTIGQREMAQLWSVDERTAKRETKRLLEAGLLKLKRQGVKGRVAAYSLDMAAIHQQTMDVWGRVGPDFSDRMMARQVTPATAPAPSTVVRVDFAAVARPTPGPQDGPWGRVRAALEQAQPAHFASWFSRLTFVSFENGQLTLRAPSRFAAQYISTHLMKDLEDATRAGLGSACRCQVVSDR